TGAGKWHATRIEGKHAKNGVSDITTMPILKREFRSSPEDAPAIQTDSALSERIAQLAAESLRFTAFQTRSRGTTVARAIGVRATRSRTSGRTQCPLKPTTRQAQALNRNPSRRPAAVARRTRWSMRFSR